MTSPAPSNTPIDGTMLPDKLCHLVSLQLGSVNEPVTRLRKSSEIQNPASMWRRLISVPASETSPLSLASISTPTSPTTFRPRLFAQDAQEAQVEDLKGFHPLGHSVTNLLY